MFLKRDIKQINKQLAEIAASDTNARLTTETFDKDISELCNAVNAVLDERRAVAVEAERASTELKRAVTNISHDLRTPLTSALGYVQMLQDANTPTEKKAEYLSIVENRLKSLTGLMNALFEYARIIEGRVEFEIEKVNVCNVLRDVMGQFYEEFTAAGFDVSLEIPDAPLCWECDVTALTRAAQNLVRNALEHGHGCFELTVSDGEVVFRNCVKDIESLDPDKIFERFYTADLSRSSGNAGLGLAIAKELIEAMGGEIKAWKDGDELCVAIQTPARSDTPAPRRRF